MELPDSAATVKAGKLATSFSTSRNIIPVSAEESRARRKMVKSPERTLISIDPNSITSEDLFTVNLRDVAVEAGANQSLERRVNLFQQRVTPDGMVVNPELDEHRDVSEFYSTKTERDRKETQAALQIRDAILNMPDGAVSVWFSPAYEDSSAESGTEKLGRITVGHNKTVDGVRECESFGIVSDLSGDQMLTSAWRLAEFTDRALRLESPEDLRNTAVILQLPELEDNPWEFLRSYIPMPNVWDAILSGEVQDNIGDVNHDAAVVAKEAYALLAKASTYNEQVAAIKTAERMMAERGRIIDHSQLDCPTVMSNESQVYSFRYGLINSKGEPMFATSETEWTYTAGHCRVCETDTEVGPCKICKDCEKKF